MSVSMFNVIAAPCLVDLQYISKHEKQSGIISRKIAIGQGHAWPAHQCLPNEAGITTDKKKVSLITHPDLAGQSA